ncbi:glutathione-disulfide reductase [Pseudanabaena sp. FACHB-1998]|uniref:glutathione-disulfide reductase n=1 Tax=Pseudanabaena sp. FACHB-1998 TaxID=2692858 RepID=UPI00168014FF|nr:glutathione-disulfide reductase [Pseudanabaena sp. FACHB-1998]MBD2178009.1 glutathione-disulfide reductase [Pseudanabaena sp. FACHB-1998]
MTDFDYDLFVIGAGSGGLAASKSAARYGAKVAIAEGDLVGGTCVIRGCVPKKLMVYASHFSHFPHESAGYGWTIPKGTLDWEKLRNAIQTEVSRLNKLHISFLVKNNVELISGFAKFVDAHTVAVGDRQFTAERILISVGGEAFKPDLAGIEYAITSKEMFLLPQFPKRFAVIGGGYIGTEFAGIMRGLGSEVTQIIRDRNILKGFDNDVRTNVQEGMVNHGINFHTCIDSNSLKIVKNSQEHENALTISFNDGEGRAQQVHTDVVLAATGRKPNLAALSLEQAGITTVNDAIAVTKDSCTNQPHIYAIGDCTNRVNLTPVAIAEGRAFADTVYGHKPRFISHKNIPSAVFSQPEAASVGLSEEKAREVYGELVKVYKTKFHPMFYSLAGGEAKTMMKLIVVGEEERVVGLHMVGKDAAEIIQGMSLVVTMGGCKKDLDNTMAMHPTAAEEFVTMQ